MARASIISIAAGSTPAAMIAEVAAPAWSVDSKPTSRVRTSSGSRVSRTVASVTTPRVPSEPIDGAEQVVAGGVGGVAAERRPVALGGDEVGGRARGWW